MITYPSDAFLCKLASIIVHVDAMLGPDGDDLDLTVVQQILVDPDVRGWLIGMTPFVPDPRGRTYSSEHR